MRCLCKGEQTGQGHSGEQVQEHGAREDRKNEEDEPGDLGCDQILVLNFEWVLVVYLLYNQLPQTYWHKTIILLCS